jgi:hypothetical protein
VNGNNYRGRIGRKSLARSGTKSTIPLADLGGDLTHTGALLNLELS